MNVNFNLKNHSKEISSIYLIVNVQNFRIKLGTGTSVKTKFWNSKTHRSRVHYSYPEAQFINAHLERISSEVLDTFYTNRNRKLTFSKEDLYNAIRAIIKGQTLDIRPKGFWDYFDSFISDKEGRVRNDVFKDYTYSLRKHLKTAEKKSTIKSALIPSDCRKMPFRKCSKTTSALKPSESMVDQDSPSIPLAKTSKT